MNENRKAFLSMIGWSEATTTSPATLNDGYDVIVTGIDGKPEIFTDYSDHPFANGRPPKRVNLKGLTSSASGRYQIMRKDWPHYKALLHLPDFSPNSQDLYALQLIRERSALPLIDGGNVTDAVRRCSNLWASFEGAGYGQREHRMEDLVAAYKRLGGEVHA